MCRTNLVGCLVLIPLSLVACDRGSDTAPLPNAPVATEPAPAPAPTPTAEQAPAPSASAEPPAPVSTKPDKIDGDGLKAGLASMTSRTVNGAKLNTNERARFHMHPEETKSATTEFDVKGLTSLEMAPFIEDLAADKNCVGNPQAGVVRLTYALDGVKKPPITVDRNYNSVVPVDVKGATRLKIEVDKGNGVTWCDWFTLGFLNVK